MVGGWGVCVGRTFESTSREAKVAPPRCGVGTCTECDRPNVERMPVFCLKALEIKSGKYKDIHFVTIRLVALARAKLVQSSLARGQEFIHQV